MRRGSGGEAFPHKRLTEASTLVVLQGIGPIQTIPGVGESASLAFVRYVRILAQSFAIQTDIDISESVDHK